MATTSTKVWNVFEGTATRVATDGSPKEGCGRTKHLYADLTGGFVYRSYLKFTEDWEGVGRIKRAILVLYTDDGLGIFDIPSETDTPKVAICRLTTKAIVGNNDDGDFDSTDYTAPTYTKVGMASANMTNEANGLNRIDITQIVNSWAPSGVKRSDGTTGAAALNLGIGILPAGSTVNVKNAWSGWSENATDATFRPIIELTYEYGPTTPDAPSSVTPSGVVASIGAFEGDFTDIRATDTLAKSTVQVFSANHAVTATAVDNVLTDTNHGLKDGDLIYFTALTGGAGLSTFTEYVVDKLSADTFWVRVGSITGTVVNITTDLTAGSWATLRYSRTQKESDSAISLGRFNHVPENLHLVVNRNYQWRARVIDQEGEASPFCSLVTFSVTNTDPDPPVLRPTSGSTRASLANVSFRGAFTDPDAGDTLNSYQVQMSAYPEGDAHWEDDEFILWNTGRRPMPVVNEDSFATPYGGDSLAAGTYYWRARVWDNHNGLSDWEYSQLILSASFEPEPDTPQGAIQQRPRAKYRIIIRDMFETDGVTRKAGRGPGNIVAVLEDPKMPGASKLFNSPGELHFTLGAEHPMLSVIEPKQTHYAIEFRQGDGWREKYQGLMWDFDATDTDIVFYGIDYLALLDLVVDERYDPSNPDKAAEKGGSKYVTAGKNSISYIVTDQLTRAKGLANSPVGFIDVGPIATMDETLTVFSTYAPTLTFVTGLLDSHRAGSGKQTRLFVRQKNGGGYEWVVQDDPGVERDDLRLKFGEIVQGYRVVAFGEDWASRISGIGRAKDGIKVMYKTASAPGIDEEVWGRFSQVRMIDGVSDENDLTRRVRQAALHAGKLGKNVAVGLRSGVIGPEDGYTLCDQFPVSIEHGSVSTAAFGSGYWSVVGVTWTVDTKTDKQDTVLTLAPREDSTPPSEDLLLLQEISPQKEWQIGWTPPPATATAAQWLDQDTGIAYKRTDGSVRVVGITGT